MKSVSVDAGNRLGDYNFGADHPFGPLRYDAFPAEFCRPGLEQQCRLAPPAMAHRAGIERSRTTEYAGRVPQASASGSGQLIAEAPPDTTFFARVWSHLS